PYLPALASACIDYIGENSGKELRFKVEEKAARFPAMASCSFFRQLLEPATWEEWCQGNKPYSWMRVI
ncbi:MAG: hypothetical protein ABL994_21620, partial [Verrucomicrobiales bacterium]